MRRKVSKKDTILKLLAPPQGREQLPAGAGHHDRTTRYRLVCQRAAA